MARQRLYTIQRHRPISARIFPDKLKIAKVIPLYKKDDPSVLDNYRPISLLPAISKLFEKVLFYYGSQYGFKKKHSTELAAAEVIDRVILKMDHNEIPINVYLDLSKAFDTLDHKNLLHKLHHYGIRGTCVALLKSYLSERKNL